MSPVVYEVRDGKAIYDSWTMTAAAARRRDRPAQAAGPGTACPVHPLLAVDPGPRTVCGDAVPEIADITERLDRIERAVTRGQEANN